MKLLFSFFPFKKENKMLISVISFMNLLQSIFHTVLDFDELNPIKKGPRTLIQDPRPQTLR